MPPGVLNGSKGGGGRGGKDEDKQFKDEDKQLALLRAVVARVDALVVIFSCPMFSSQEKISPLFFPLHLCASDFGIRLVDALFFSLIPLFPSRCTVFYFNSTFSQSMHCFLL